MKNSIFSKKKFPFQVCFNISLYLPQNTLEFQVQTTDLFGKFRADFLISKYVVLVSDLICKSLMIDNVIVSL